MPHCRAGGTGRGMVQGMAGRMQPAGTAMPVPLAMRRPTVPPPALPPLQTAPMCWSSAPRPPWPM